MDRETVNSLTEQFKLVQKHLGEFADYRLVLVAIAVLVVVSFFGSRLLLRWIVKKLPHGERSTRDLIDLLRQHGILRTVSLFGPVIVLSWVVRVLVGRVGRVTDVQPWFLEGVLSILSFLSLVLLFVVLDKLVQLAHSVYANSKSASFRPLESYFVFARIGVFAIGVVVVISTLLNQNTNTVLAAIGASSALLALLFRNSFLSFSAGLQVAGNDLLGVGDWIESEELGVNGEVFTIALHTVKVRNWDKTVVSVPTHRLTEVTFKNWRGMREFGGRRFKRAVLLDSRSVSFCDEEMLKRIRALEVPGLDGPLDPPAAKTEPTNLDWYQHFVEQLLTNDDRVSARGVRMVRQLDPLEDGGLPVEVYCFLEEVHWVEFEAIQSELFAHIVASAEAFSLNLFTRSTLPLPAPK